MIQDDHWIHLTPVLLPPSRRCAVRTTSTAVLRATTATWRRGRARRSSTARWSTPSLRGRCCTPRPETPPKASYPVAGRGKSNVPRKTRAAQHQPPSGPAAPRPEYVQRSALWNLKRKNLCENSVVVVTNLTPHRLCAARTRSTAVPQDSPATWSLEAASSTRPPGTFGLTSPPEVHFKTGWNQPILWTWFFFCSLLKASIVLVQKEVSSYLLVLFGECELWV